MIDELRLQTIVHDNEAIKRESVEEKEKLLAHINSIIEQSRPESENQENNVPEKL